MTMCLPVVSNPTYNNHNNYQYCSMFPPQPIMFTKHNDDSYARRKSLVQCANCGGMGHVYKTCNHPVISYGIICYKADYDQDTNSVCPKYLMVQRKDSLCYVEFIRGKYDPQKKDYLVKLFSNMTIEEREKIRNNTFEALWNSMWCRSTHTPEENTKNFNKEFKEAKERFDLLKKGYFLVNPANQQRYFLDMTWLLDNTEVEFNETEWGFPKGRRNINETDISCALREFKEETGIQARNIKICRHVKPLEEIFTGTNRIRYKHIYYVAKYTPDQQLPSDLLFNPQNKTQVKEVKDVQWFRYQEAQDKIRPNNVERKELFKRLNQIIIRSFQ